MHIPDGFLTPQVWGTMDLVAVPAVALLARRAQKEFDHHKVPLMGAAGHGGDTHIAKTKHY